MPAILSLPKQAWYGAERFSAQQSASKPGPPQHVQLCKTGLWRPGRDTSRLFWRPVALVRTN